MVQEVPTKCKVCDWTHVLWRYLANKAEKIKRLQVDHIKIKTRTKEAIMSVPVYGSCRFPADTQRNNNAILTQRRFDVIMTSLLMRLLVRLTTKNRLHCLPTEDQHQAPLRKWVTNQRARFTWPTWGPTGSCRPQVGPMWDPWTLLSGY